MAIQSSVSQLELALLQQLDQGSVTGYELTQIIAGGGAIYPALHRLERDGLVIGSWRRRADGALRRFYRISAEGHTIVELAQPRMTTLAQQEGAA
jgi:PadR family transcriptional regulator, regulatory protein PadR